jgi:hypothetical protein
MESGESQNFVVVGRLEVAIRIPLPVQGDGNEECLASANRDKL